MEQTTTAAANTSGALHVIRGIFSFMLSVLLIILLLFNGLLFPMKFTFIKGNSVNEIFKNLNVYEMLHEVMAETFDENYSKFSMSRELYEIIFTDENFEEICDTIITAIMNDEDIDLSFLEENIVNTVKSEVITTIDSAFSEIAANNIENSFNKDGVNHNVINASVLASNTALNNFKNAYGLDISSIIMNVISTQYGVESIDLNYIDINTVKSFVTDSIETTVYPEIENAISETIDEASASINAEIQASLQEAGIKENIILFESSIAGFNMLIIAIFAVIATIMFIQIIMYHSCLYRAFRNFSTSALFSGLIIAGLGFISSLAFPIAIDEVAGEVNSTAFVNFIDKLIAPFFRNITNIGVAYLAAFVVCLILSIIFKAKYKKRINASA